MRWYLILLAALSLAVFCMSHGSTGVDYAALRQKADRPLEELLALLQGIKTGKELRRQAPALERAFSALYAVMRQAEEALERHPQRPPPPLSDAQRRRNAALHRELQRVAALVGGKQLLGEVQRRVLR